MPCIQDIGLADLTTSDNCSLKKGLQCGYWTQYSNVDWQSMAANGGFFDQATQTINTYSMIGGAVWNAIRFTKRGSSYTSTFNRDENLYDHVLNLLFRGQSQTFRNAMCRIINTCKIIIHLLDRDCNARVFGVDWTGSEFIEPLDDFVVTEHVEQSGDVGGDESQNTVTIGGQTDCPALYSTLTSKTIFEAGYL